MAFACAILAVSKSQTSQRALEYEVSENVSMNSKLHDIKPMFKTALQSPDPKMDALQMYNWLNEKVKKMKKVMVLSISKTNNLNLIRSLLTL